MTDTAPDILVADDDEFLRGLVRRSLERGGWRVSAFEDGPALLEAARRSPPRLVVLDYSMPGMTGGEVARALRAEPATGDALIVLLTAHSGFDDASLREWGVDRCLGKPFSPRTLRELVDELLGRP